MRVRHIALDWDGTILDSAELVVQTDNVLAKRFGWATADVDYLRTNLTREWRDYYDGLRLLAGGVPLTDEEISEVAATWLLEHSKTMERAELLAGVEEAMASALARGCTLSICSMQSHSHLVGYVEKFDLNNLFILVDGLKRADDGRTTKDALFAEHLARLEELGVIAGPSDVMMIGDSVDDALAAAAAGAGAVLVSTGETTLERLLEAGFPVVGDLAAAIELAT